MVKDLESAPLVSPVEPSFKARTLMNMKSEERNTKERLPESDECEHESDMFASN